MWSVCRALASALVVAMLAAGSAHAAAACQPITVVNHVPHRITATQLANDERAVTKQSRQVAAAWHVAPACFVAAGGWQLALVATTHDPTESGFHSASSVATPSGVIWTPFMIVEAEGWRITLSHEVIEALVDPTATRVRPEIADRVEGWSYRIDHVLVSDWMWPDRHDALWHRRR